MEYFRNYRPIKAFTFCGRIKTSTIEINATGFGESTKSEFSSPSVCNSIYQGNPQYYNPLTISPPYFDVNGDGILDINFRETYVSDNH